MSHELVPELVLVPLMSSQLQVNQRSFTKMRTGCATSTCMRDKHEDRPGDPNMRGHFDLDNNSLSAQAETKVKASSELVSHHLSYAICVAGLGCDRCRLQRGLTFGCMCLES